jgi:hypothetical protein
MEDKPTSSKKNFLFELQFSTKCTFLFDLTVESGDNEEENSIKEQEEQLAVIRVSGMKLNSSTSIVRAQEGQAQGKILTEEEAPPVIYSTYGLRLRGFYHAFQVTFIEFGSIVQISPKGIKTGKQSKDKDLFTVTTFEFVEDKDYHQGFDC